PLDEKEQPEGGQDSVRLELVLAAAAPYQGHERVAIEQGAQDGGDEGQEHDGQQRRGAELREQDHGRQRRCNQHFTIGQVQDAGDTVLQVEAQRYQRIGPAQCQPEEQSIEQGHGVSPYQAQPGLAMTGLAPGLSGCTAQKVSPCHWPTTQASRAMLFSKRRGPERVSKVSLPSTLMMASRSRLPT